MNPRNWPLWRKGVVVSIISGITFFTPLASSMFAPGIPSVMKDFDTTNQSLGTFTVSVYILVWFSIFGLTWRDSQVVRYFGRLCLRCMVELLFSISRMCFSLHIPLVVVLQIPLPLLLFCDSLRGSTGVHV